MSTTECDMFETVPEFEERAAEEARVVCEWNLLVIEIEGEVAEDMSDFADVVVPSWVSGQDEAVDGRLSLVRPLSNSSA